MKHFPETFVIVDTETSGMRPPFSRVIDIGIIRVENGVETDRFQTLLNPGISIPSYIRRFTNITDEDLSGAPAFEEVALRIEELLAGAVFVAHNAPFDYAFIKSEFGRLDMPFSAPTLCSVKFSRGLMPKARSHNLDAVIERYGLPRRERHRALPDAEAVWDFFQKSGEVHDEDEIVRALARAQGTQTPQLARDTFNDLPDQSGVYFFYGPDQELLYIGKSKHVRTRARSHFQGSGGRKEARLKAETHTVASRRTSGELSALILEAALIKQESPLYNKALRKRKTLVLAKEVMNDYGYPTVVLERTADVSPDISALSVFRTTTQAKETLRRIAKEHRLCPKLLGAETGPSACFSYQLGLCKGACIEKEAVGEYAERFRNAFETRRLKAWPYKGPIVIEEAERQGQGTVFFIDEWVLKGAFRYEDDSFEPLVEGIGTGAPFDYDTYKILVRYLLNPKNRRSVRVLTQSEFARRYAECIGEQVDEMYEEDVIP